MNQPTECKYCGCNKFNADSVSMTRFRCGSSYWPQAKMWQLSNECAHKCAVQSAELRERVQRADQDIEFMKAREANFVTALRSRLRTLNERIQRAVEVLEGGDRIIMVLDENDKDVVPATDVDQVIEILKGETDGQAD